MQNGFKKLRIGNIKLHNLLYIVTTIIYHKSVHCI